MRCAWVLVLAAGCVTDGLVPCGDKLCKTGSLCTAIGCASPDQLKQCDGMPDGAACVADGIDGVCSSGVCDLIICGDGRVVGPEQCDDGNQKANDGCSADCLSNETCGNGVVDGIKGEQCDDGLYGLSGDGCSSLCQTELDAWSDVEPTLPSIRTSHALAYDARRGRVVLFGGSGSGTLDDTWEWDGMVWRHIVTRTTPARRYQHGMSYDPERGVVVMFGGTTFPNMQFFDTWEWDGVDWTQRTPAASPPAGPCEMTYDAHDHHIVVVTGAPVQTWIWDGTTWTDRTPAISPTVLGPIAFDTETQRVVLYAGSATISETWSWDGTAWTNVTPSAAGTQPPARTSTTIAATADGHVMLFGGASGLSAVGDEWLWAGGRWTLQGETIPTARQDAAMVSNATGLVLFGGRNGGANNQTWVRGAGWTLAPFLTPFPRGSAAWVFEATRGKTLVYGGGNGTTFADAWEWDGLAWTPVASGPGPRSGAEMVAVRDKVLLFGGSQPSTGLGQTWQWDGTQWTQLFPAHSPQERRAHRLAYDARRDRVVMFGGQLTGIMGIDETWEWDGTDWTQMSPAHRPTPRYDPMLVYDAARGTVVLFGGINGGTQSYVDTWTWDGTDWTALAPPAQPPLGGRFFAGAYDPLRRSVFMFRTDAVAAINDLWEWDGATWMQRDSAVPPPLTLAQHAIYDSVHTRFVIFDEAAGTSHAHWAHRFVGVNIQPDSCLDVDTDGDGLAGCADPDCWARCSPTCPPRTTCDPSAPHCGDGACSSLEDHRLCPADCP